MDFKISLKKKIIATIIYVIFLMTIGHFTINWVEFFLNIPSSSFIMLIVNTGISLVFAFILLLGINIIFKKIK